VGRKGFPDSAHPFQNPPSGAQRGGCPGLNLLANYGYIARSGITNVGELLFAMQEAMGGAPSRKDGTLVALSFRGMTDPTTLKMSIGGTDSRTSGIMSWLFGGTVPGLFSAPSHSRYEHDGSLAFDDAYFTPGGTTSQFNGTLWKQRRQSADNDFNGVVQPRFQARFNSYDYWVQNNPQCAWVIVSQLLFYGAENLLWLHFPSSNTDGTVGPATAAAVETFSGILESPAGVFSKVPEKFPVGIDGKWYRRGVPLTVSML
ncbi:Chloroperoxidase, partial [Leucosporidium creatinivorum]